MGTQERTSTLMKCDQLVIWMTTGLEDHHGDHHGLDHLVDHLDSDHLLWSSIYHACDAVEKLCLCLQRLLSWTIMNLQQPTLCRPKEEKISRCRKYLDLAGNCCKWWYSGRIQLEQYGCSNNCMIGLNWLVNTASALPSRYKQNPLNTNLSQQWDSSPNSGPGCPLGLDF